MITLISKNGEQRPHQAFMQNSERASERNLSLGKIIYIIYLWQVKTISKQNKTHTQNNQKPVNLLSIFGAGSFCEFNGYWSTLQPPLLDHKMSTSDCASNVV